MKKMILAVTLCLTAAAFSSFYQKVTHEEFQAVNSDGETTFTGQTWVQIEGIILNTPEKWLDPTAEEISQPWNLGGEWEIFIQGEGDDHAGTAVWIGQNYGNGPGDANYPNDEWISELQRINYDPNTGYTFTAGDRVMVRGTYLFYKGKLNINENHNTEPYYNFEVHLLEPAVGLPQPETVDLSDLKDQNDDPIFDPTRQTGCEYYQARRIRINDVNIVNTENWGPDTMLTVRDANGLTFDVYTRLGRGFSTYPCPTGQIDVIGILDQLSPGQKPNLDHTRGYRLLVMDYDGNGMVLTDRDKKRGNLPVDANNDYKVDLRDFEKFAEQWLMETDGLYIEEE